MTIASHVCKPRKAVIFLSTIHRNAEIIVENDGKPISDINKYYNETKAGVDTLDQMVHEYDKEKDKSLAYCIFHESD